MRRASVFDHPEPSSRNLTYYPMIKEDDTVRDKLFQALPSKLIAGSFAGDDRCHTPLFQPAEQPAEFGPQNRFVGYPGKEGFDGIKNHAFCSEHRNGVSEPNE